MKLCSYVVSIDHGLAPNPFWGFCTLAVCTPNHQGCRLQPGDWILGNSSTDTGRGLIYAMRVSEVLDFDAYYRDERFGEKRPSNRGWRERRGDNMYFRNEGNQWVQACAFFHTSPEQITQDTRYPRVFVSDHYFYFGKNAPTIPEKFAALLHTRQGCKYHEVPLVGAFIDWLERAYQPGLHGQPRDREEETGAQCDVASTGNLPVGTKRCN